MSDNQEKTSYYLRLVSMYIDLSTETALSVFKHHVPNNDPVTFLTSDETRKKLDALKKRKILNKQEYDLATEKLPDPNKFDISLLATLTVNLLSEKHLAPPEDGWQHPPKSGDKSIAADILRLRYIRNVIIGHQPKAQLELWQFDEVWNSTEEVLLRLQSNIDPKYKPQLQDRIEVYKHRSLHSNDERKYGQQLREWYEEVLEIQTQVDALFQKLEDIDVYFQNSSKYERYMVLMVKGGRFVLASRLNALTKHSDLKIILQGKEDILKEKISDPDQIRILFSSLTSAYELDVFSWNVALLANVLVHAIDNIDDDVRDDIEYIKHARENFAEMFLKALRNDTFDEISSELKARLKFISKCLETEQKRQCFQIIEECKQQQAEEICIHELKSEGIKSIADIHKETLQQTKLLLARMMKQNMAFKEDHILVLKMITCGTNKEKKKLAERVLVDVWQLAIRRSGQGSDFPDIEQEVYKILEKIKEIGNISETGVEQKCIIVWIATFSPQCILALIEYFESRSFHERIVNISRDVGYYFDTILRMKTSLTIESLYEIQMCAKTALQSQDINQGQVLPNKEIRNQKAQPPIQSGIRLPVSVASPAAMMKLLSILKQENLSKSTTAIGAALSKHFDERIRLDLVADRKGLHDLFDKDCYNDRGSFSGVIVDVSGSMRNGIGYDVDNEGKWVRSIFDVIDDLVANDVTSDDKVFVIGVGASRINEAFDVLKAIQLSENEESADPCPASYRTIDDIFVTLETRGARYIRKWVEKSLVREVLLQQEASLVLRKLKSDPAFTSKFVNEYLPKTCRDWADNDRGLPVFTFLTNQVQNLQSSVVSSFRQATHEDIKEVLQKAMFDLLRVSDQSILAANDAADILRGSHGQRKLTTERSQEKHRKIEPHIYGSTPSIAACDVLKAVQLSENEESAGPCPASYRTIDDIFVTLETRGARYIRKWVEKSLVREVLLQQEASLVLRKLKSDPAFTSKFVNEYLPEVCRDWAYNYRDLPVFTFLTNQVQNLQSLFVTSFRPATRADIEEVLQKAMTYLRVSDRSILDVNYAADVQRGSKGRQKLTTERSQEIHRKIEPHIYGCTPLFSAFREASTLLSDRRYKTFDKLLFVLSDGEPSDFGNIDTLKSKLGDKVPVVSCYISTDQTDRIEPRRLYSVLDPTWDCGAQFLFNVSSFVPTKTVTRAIFSHKKWKIDITNNKTRLFMYVNHPENVKSAFELARKALTSHDTLIDLLVSIPLDVYINQTNSNKNIPVPDQEWGTCYANASATVLHLAMRRILGRENGYPDFETIRNDMIHSYGIDGANTLDVLRTVCPIYRLRCRKVNTEKALEAIAKKRPVVARFKLTERDWGKFKHFFKHSGEDVLTKQDLDRDMIGKRKAHAVVLTSYNSRCLYLMNSWGETWADKGFFRIENADVLGLEFIDIYWKKEDLTSSEINYYRTCGASVASRLFNALEGLKAGKFKCPSSSCHRSSNISQFTGTISRVTCPLCNHEFNSFDGNGNILALNMYLTSLCK